MTSHSNTIMDYTFYWFLSIYDYYMYSGDKDFVTQLYPRMQSMMDYVLGRTNANGMVEGMTGDWVFVDWADGYLDKKGELSFEQVLFCKSLETMALCASLAGNTADKTKYEKLASALRSKLEPAFWNEQKQAMVHNRIQGKQSESVTRYANMFSVFFNYLNADKQQAIKHSVLQNDSILKITTPYMRFYELEALCALGEQESVMKEMKAYWGRYVERRSYQFLGEIQSRRNRYPAFGHVRTSIRQEPLPCMGSQPHLFVGQILSGSKTHQTRLRRILRHPLSGRVEMDGRNSTYSIRQYPYLYG